MSKVTSFVQYNDFDELEFAEAISIKPDSKTVTKILNEYKEIKQLTLAKLQSERYNRNITSLFN